MLQRGSKIIPQPPDSWDRHPQCRTAGSSFAARRAVHFSLPSACRAAIVWVAVKACWNPAHAPERNNLPCGDSCLSGVFHARVDFRFVHRLEFRASLERVCLDSGTAQAARSTSAWSLHPPLNRRGRARSSKSIARMGHISRQDANLAVGRAVESV